MSFNRVSSADRTATAGAALAIDPSNPVHMLYTGAAVIGAATVVTAVGVTTIAAPGLVLVPAAAAGGCVAGAAFLADRATRETTDDAPAADAAVA